MHVIVTGAGGHLGRKVFDFLETQPGITVSGLDIRLVDHPRIQVADFAADPSWAAHFDGVDVIVRLAGDREPTAGLDSAIPNNMDATLAIYHEAAAKGVSRVVFASSNWLHGDKRFTEDALTLQATPGPVNPYGMSKLFCDRTGAYVEQHRGLSIICMRIGWTQWTHDSEPGPHMAMGRRGQEMWLSDRDYLNRMFAAITAPEMPFAVLNPMSDNPGMRWDMEETKRAIGYRPQDSYTATVTPRIRLQSWLKKVITFSLPNWFAQKFPEW